MNFDEPFWELEGATTWPAIFNQLNHLLPEDCILYFEDGLLNNQLLDFFENNAITEQAQIAVGTVWPKPLIYHVPSTYDNIKALSLLSENINEYELAMHFHVYKDRTVLLQWHDVFMDPMFLSGLLPSDKVEIFAAKLGMSIIKWRNIDEQMSNRSL